MLQRSHSVINDTVSLFVFPCPSFPFFRSGRRIGHCDRSDFSYSVMADDGMHLNLPGPGILP